MRSLIFTFFFSLPIILQGQSSIDELRVKKEGFSKQINSLKDSVTAIELKIQNAESESIRAKITDGNFIPIRTKVKENYSPFYKNEKMLDSFVLLTIYDYVNVIGVSTTNTDLAKVQYQGNLGFIQIANLDMSASDKKIIDAIIMPIFEAQKKASSEKLEAQKKVEELREKYETERSKRSRDSIVQRLSDLRIKEAEEARIAKAKKVEKANKEVKVVATKQQPEQVVSNNSYTTTEEKIKTLMKDEPKVKDYVFTDSKVLYASVLDDGTSRNGYAEYLYYALKEVNIKPYKVVVVKLGSHNDPKRDNAFGVKLGEYKE